MKQKLRFAGVICALLTFGVPLQANQCDDLFEAAKEACQDVRHTCDDVKICNILSGKCTQNANTEQGCNAFNSCLLQNTSTIYRSACSVKWNSQSGQCTLTKFFPGSGKPDNCPTAASNLPQRCEPQYRKLSDQQQACKAAQRNLAAQICGTKYPSIRTYNCKLP